MSKGSGVNFVELFSGPEWLSVSSAVLVAVGVTATAYFARKELEKCDNPVIPDASLTLRNLFDLLAVFILNLGDNVMGKENRKYLPFVATLFFYILMMNLLGLIPGFLMPTDSLAINLGIALTVFVLYHYWGIREVGVRSYAKHFIGPVALLAPLMVVIELVSHMVRPFSLSLRLFGNMTGDHIVLAVATDLTKYGIPVIFYFLGAFVCFIQAFVFTLLTMIYIRFAVTHAEGH